MRFLKIVYQLYSLCSSIHIYYLYLFVSSIKQSRHYHHPICQMESPRLTSHSAIDRLVDVDGRSVAFIDRSCTAKINNYTSTIFEANICWFDISVHISKGVHRNKSSNNVLQVNFGLDLIEMSFVKNDLPKIKIITQIHDNELIPPFCILVCLLSLDHIVGLDIFHSLILSVKAFDNLRNLI